MGFRSFMLRKVAFCFKIHAAQIARVRAFVGVSTDVLLQYAWLRTHSSTIFATIFPLFPRIFARSAFRSRRQARILFGHSIELA